ncbi:MAG: helix-turn-helix transcriptional regulator [Oscillospiraceae bacterium]|nr:helix-turn-helix transcriptional regulator [Oscillospiraceae bacterium]
MLGKRLKAIRTEKGISQKELAAQLFVSAQAVSKWEREEASPNPEAIVKMAEIFGITTDELLGSVTFSGAATGRTIEDIETASLSDDSIKAAFWGGDQDLTPEELDAMWQDVKNFAAFVAEQKRREKGGEK